MIGLGEMYVADPRFGANYGGDGGTRGAEFVRDALRVYAEAQPVGASPRRKRRRMPRAPRTAASVVFP